MPAAGKTPGTPRKKTIAAGPRPAAAPRGRKAEPSALERLQSVIVGSLEDDKAEMAEHLSERLHQSGLRRVQVEGAGGADWVLIDAGDIIVHLFKPEARATYALEKMWGAELDDVAPG